MSSFTYTSSSPQCHSLVPSPSSWTHQGSLWRNHWLISASPATLGCEKLVAQTIAREQVSLGSGRRSGHVLLIRSVLTDGSSLGIINHLFVQDVEWGMAMSIQILG